MTTKVISNQEPLKEHDQFDVICDVLQAMKETEEDEIFDFIMGLKKYNVMICQYDDTYVADKGRLPFYGWEFNPICVDEMQIVAENNVCKIKLLGESLTIVLKSIIFDLPLGLPMIKFDVLGSHLKIKKVAFFKYLTVGIDTNKSIE